MNSIGTKNTGGHFFVGTLRSPNLGYQAHSPLFPPFSPVKTLHFSASAVSIRFHKSSGSSSPTDNRIRYGDTPHDSAHSSSV